MISNPAADAMGQAANAAALAVTRLEWRLQVAASGNVTRAERADAAVHALRQWPAICRAMAALEVAAPNLAQRARDFIEAGT